MRKTTTALATLLLTSGALTATAGTASAEMHRGKSNCFTYSYSTDGFWRNSTTVYYHNTCKRSSRITVVRKGNSDWSTSVGGDVHGSKKLGGDILHVYGS